MNAAPRFKLGDRVIIDHQWSAGGYSDGKYECVVTQSWKDPTKGERWYGLDILGTPFSTCRTESSLVPMSTEAEEMLEMIPCSHCNGRGKVRRRQT